MSVLQLPLKTFRIIYIFAFLKLFFCNFEGRGVQSATLYRLKGFPQTYINISFFMTCRHMTYSIVFPEIRKVESWLLLLILHQQLWGKTKGLSHNPLDSCPWTRYIYCHKFTNYWEYSQWCVIQALIRITNNKFLRVTFFYSWHYNVSMLYLFVAIDGSIRKQC